MSIRARRIIPGRSRRRSTSTTTITTTSGGGHILPGCDSESQPSSRPACSRRSPGAAATVRLGAHRIVVSAPSGSRAVIARAPLRIRFEDAAGRTVLEQVAPDATLSVERPPVPRAQSGVPGPPPPTLYAPLAFTVGSHSIAQTRSGIWEGNLQSVTVGGDPVRGPRRRRGDAATGRGPAAGFDLGPERPPAASSTSRPDRRGMLRVSARPTPDEGVGDDRRQLRVGAGRSVPRLRRAAQRARPARRASSTTTSSRRT